MDAIRKKIALVYFGVEGMHANPIIDIILKIIQMLLGGGICPTPAKALAWAKRHPRITEARTQYLSMQVVDDHEEAVKITGVVTTLLPDTTDEEAAAIAAARD